MVQRLKQYIIIALIIVAFYFVLSHHFVFSSLTSIEIVKKKELSLSDTIISLTSEDPKDLLKIEALRESGIGDMLMEKGFFSEKEINKILREIDEE